MARKRVSFVSALGQAFEVLRNITNAVLDLGGDEEDVLKILRKPQMAKEIALYLVGMGRVEIIKPEEAVFIAQSQFVREMLVGKIEDLRVLYRLATHDEMPSIRLLATGRITNEKQLFWIVDHCDIKDEFIGVAACAISRMTVPENLVEIVRTTRYPYSTRSLAAERINSLGHKTTIKSLVDGCKLHKDSSEDEIKLFLRMYSCIEEEDDVSVDIHAKARAVRQLLHAQNSTCSEQSSAL